MSWGSEQLRAVSDRVVRRVRPCCAILGGPLLVLVILVTAAPAEEAGMGSSTMDVRRGVAVQSAPARTAPKVWRSPQMLHQLHSQQEMLPNEPVQQAGYQQVAYQQPQPQPTAAAPPAPTTAENLPLPPQMPGSQPMPNSQWQVEGQVPMSGWDANVDIIQGANGRIDRLVVRDASLSKVLALLAQTYHLNIVASNDLDAVISITLRDVALEEALTAILSVANYTWVNRDGIILITSLADSTLAPGVQGRHMQIFDLDFASASTISEAITGFLSPIGKMSIVESDPTDNRRTREMIVIEDIPEAIARVAAYIEQVDCPPRQVQIEAHILQVTLRDNEKNGVDFNALARIAGARLNIGSVGFVPDPTDANKGFYATLTGGDLTGIIRLLQTTTDTKTLGSPKVLVLNQQEAKIHVGEDLGYQTTVTSELQSTQAPQFLQIGVLLNIRPRITRDGRVLLHVRPEVSTGAIDPLTQVPNKKTTELETDVMLRDGEGMIIGGLIDEQDHTAQNKIPYLGDLWRVGFFFRESEVLKERKEVIIAIVPRIQPYAADYEDFEEGELIRAQTPLFQGPLCYTDRPFDAHLPDGKRVARPYIPPRANLPAVNNNPCNNCKAPWPNYYIPQKPYPQQNFVDEYRGEYGPGDCAEPRAPAPLEVFVPSGEGPQVYQPGGYPGEVSNGGVSDGSYDGEFISDQP
jgi:type IV pilus assembly protein PilQ